MRNKNNYQIGIDPGSNTGLAIWNRHTKELTLHQFKSHGEAAIFVYTLVKDTPGEYHIIIEDARLVTKNARRIPRKFLSPELIAKSAAKQQGVGYVKGYSKDWEAIAKLLKVSYELRPPMNTKYTVEDFRRLTGIITTKTQDHIRDAGLLVFKS